MRGRGGIVGGGGGIVGPPQSGHGGGGGIVGGGGGIVGPPQAELERWQNYRVINSLIANQMYRSYRKLFSFLIVQMG